MSGYNTTQYMIFDEKTQDLKTQDLKIQDPTVQVSPPSYHQSLIAIQSPPSYHQSLITIQSPPSYQDYLNTQTEYIISPPGGLRVNNSNS